MGETPQSPYGEDQERMAAIAGSLPTKAAKIRALTKAGYSRSAIAAHLGIRYQHVRTVQTQVEPASVAAPAPSKPQMAAERAPHVHIVLDVDANGHVILPPEVRAAIGLSGPGKLVAVCREWELRMITPERGIARAQAIVAKLGLKGTELTDSFLAEKRFEVAREEAEFEEWSKRS